MQTYRLMWGIVLMVAVVVWAGWGTPLAWGQRARVPQTGQTTSHASGDDGAIQAGVEWPTPRFTNRGDGTVRDNLTGLIWLRVANCFGVLPWPQALTVANMLADGQCGLMDKSKSGDWRLPNVRELLSLADYGFILPALSNAAGTAQCTATDCAFSDVQWVGGDDAYWSSTPRADFPSAVFLVHMGEGKNNSTGQDAPFFVWPVRGND